MKIFNNHSWKIMPNFFTPKLQDAYYEGDVDGDSDRDVDGVGDGDGDGVGDGDGDKNCFKKMRTLQMFVVSVLLRGHLKRFNSLFIKTRKKQTNLIW